MKFILPFFCSLLLTSSVAMAQQDAWPSLTSITFNKVYDEVMGMEVDKPVFGIVQQSLNGKEITLRGYIIPLEGKVKQSHFMFSVYPISMCFFCGNAGPETVAEVFMANGQKLPYVEDKIHIKGTLQLNPSDPSGTIYKLINAQLIEG
jgi:hypothetical protein